MPERLEIIARSVHALAVDYKVDAAGVETGIVYRGRKTTLLLAQVRGAILQSLFAAGCAQILDVNNVTAKASVGASHLEGKEAVRRGVQKLVVGVAHGDLNDDEVDAVAVSFAVSVGKGKPA